MMKGKDTGDGCSSLETRKKSGHGMRLVEL